MSNTDLLSSLQIFMIDHHFKDNKNCILDLKQIIKSKEKDFKQLDKECFYKLNSYLTMLDTQFDKQVSNSILISSIKNYE